MILIRMSITILLIATFRAAVDGYGLPIFYSIDKEWKNTADDHLGFNNDHQSDTLGTWNNFNKKAHKMFPSVVSQLQIKAKSFNLEKYSGPCLIIQFIFKLI